jgi:sulfide:quinone oxidoreductase
MALPKVLVLGSGFGGLAAAHALRDHAAERVDVLVVDRSPTFRMGLRKLWLLDGRSGPGEGGRERSGLAAVGIPFRQGTVERVDLGASRVRIDGQDQPYDFLVVALGAEPRMDLVPGNPDAAPSLYTFDGAAAIAERLGGLEQGRVVFLIAGVPYKCPPAPFEAALIIEDHLRRTGRREAIEIEILSPQPMSIPAAGPAACAHVEGRLKERGIAFRPSMKLQGIEPGRVSLEGGESVEADLLILVPPNRPPAVVKESGLTGEGEWVQADPGSLATDHGNVFAIGDLVEMTTGVGMPFPKAGVFAERHGEVVGKNIAAAVGGTDPAERFDGTGYCFLEVGGGMASMVVGNFFASPPDVRIEEPTAAHLEAKVSFESERLERWFPGGGR